MEVAASSDAAGSIGAAADGLSGGRSQETPLLTAVEAQRVTAVLQGMVKKLGLLGTLASTPTSTSSSRSPSFHYDELSRFVREEVDSHLKEHQRLEAKHAELSQQWDRLIRQGEEYEEENEQESSAAQAWGTDSGLAEGGRRQEIEKLKAELQATGQALSQNAQYICRQLKENPRVGGFALKVERERVGLLQLLESVAEELQACAGWFGDTLCGKVAAEAFAQEHLTRVLEEERTASEALLKIEGDVRTGAGQLKGRLRELQEAIAQLHTQLDAVQYKSEVETKYARREGKARVGAVQRVFVQEERDLARKLARLKAQDAMERKTHEDLLGYLRGKHQETAAQVEAWREKSARELGELDAELQRLAEARTRALEELVVRREWRREEQAHEAAEKEAERLRQVEERKTELLLRARRRAKTKVEAAVAVYALSRRAKKEQEEAAAAAAAAAAKKGKGKAKGKKGDAAAAGAAPKQARKK